jgi:DNA-binding protein HU-beta
MTKAELAQEIATRMGIPKQDTVKMLNVLTGVIMDQLRDGKQIFIRGFCTFQLKPRKAKVARNLQTEQQILVPARVVPSVKFVSEFIKQVNESELAHKAVEAAQAKPKNSRKKAKSEAE